MSNPTSSQQFRVLVVDDEAALRKVIRVSLVASGFVVQEAGTGSDAVDAFRQGQFDLVLLDVNMPGISGVEVCRQLRSIAPQAGIVMLTVRDTAEDKVRALEAGADDYVTKPFQFRDLVARLRAVLRRTHSNGTASVLHAGDLTMDVENRVVSKSGEAIHLLPKEFDLLAFMMEHQGAPLTHANLLCRVWGAEYGGDLEFLRSLVRMLREKIEDNPARPQYIITEPWVGYRFRDPADPDQQNSSADDE